MKARLVFAFIMLAVFGGVVLVDLALVEFQHQVDLAGNPGWLESGAPHWPDRRPSIAVRLLDRGKRARALYDLHRIRAKVDKFLDVQGHYPTWLRPQGEMYVHGIDCWNSIELELGSGGTWNYDDAQARDYGTDPWRRYYQVVVDPEHHVLEYFSRGSWTREIRVSVRAKYRES